MQVERRVLRACERPLLLTAPLVLAEHEHLHRVLVRDHLVRRDAERFAAGALLDGIGPVWGDPESYLTVVESMGLVFGEAITGTDRNSSS